MQQIGEIIDAHLPQAPKLKRWDDDFADESQCSVADESIGNGWAPGEVLPHFCFEELLEMIEQGRQVLVRVEYRLLMIETTNKRLRRIIQQPIDYSVGNNYLIAAQTLIALGLIDRPHVLQSYDRDGSRFQILEYPRLNEVVEPGQSLLSPELRHWYCGYHSRIKPYVEG